MTVSKALKIIFAGTPEFAAQSFSALLQSHHQIIAVYTQPDRPAGRGQKLTASPVKALALAHHLPIFQPQTLRDDGVQAELQRLAADVMVVAAYGLILPLSILAAPRLGCLNIHASLLPRWRGAAPIQRAILTGDKKTGITIMQMDAGLDTGAMLYQQACDILPTDTSQTLQDKLAQLGSESILTVLDLLETGQLKPEVQDDSAKKYAEKIQKSEARIDWSVSAAEIQRKIRAFNPWPVAYAYWGDEVVRIWAAEVIDVGGNRPQQGGDTIDVAAGDGNILRIQQLQFPGGRVLSAKEVLNARRDEFRAGKKVFS